MKTNHQIRAEQSAYNRFRALALILKVDNGTLFDELIGLKEKELTKDQLKAEQIMLEQWAKG